MKTGIAMLAAILLVGGTDPLWAQLAGHEAETWTTPAYGEGGAIATTAYGESGTWVTAAFNGVDAGTLKGGLGGDSTGAGAGPASRPRSSLLEPPIFGTQKPPKTATAAKAGAKPALSSTNAPSGIEFIGGTTNAVQPIVPAEDTQSTGPMPATPSKSPGPGETRKP
ncbi:MAG TPA: hypothetical protein VNT26_07465 [Candidatus Sulfotelmatobacter sp.]|nr:hypothetical protein [Candidatus Sulfotelmatobacter sp.]